jgi:predicted ABC-type ATPase
MFSSRSLERKFERKNILNVKRVSGAVDRAYNKAMKKISIEIQQFRLKGTKPFSFKYNKSFGNRLSGIIGEMNREVDKAIKSSMVQGWQTANKKNDVLAAQYLRNFKRATGQHPSFFNANVGAMNEFVNRSVNGLDLSANIWKQGAASMDLLETYMGTGIAAGRSSQRLSRDVRSLLKEPDKALRRVRGKDGVLRPSKAMKAYKPGRGVYKSPYKNAMRMARTETNMAYRAADHMRYKQMDFVIGIQVHLSSAHPKYDICDHMVGKYPKTFQFLGWHPNCYCYQTSILASQTDFLNSLKGAPIPRSKYVTGMTNRAQAYIQKNMSKFKNYKRLPYWISKNQYHIEKALNTPILPRAAKTQGYKDAEKWWKNDPKNPYAYHPEGYGLEMYEKAMKMDSEAMKDILKLHGKTKNQLLKEVQEVREKLKTLKPTTAVHFDKKTGLWTKKREELHNKIADHFLAGKPALEKKPKLLMTGGYPGSGKSTMLNQAYPGWKEKYVHIDSDAIKNLLAQADGFKDVGWRASAYHKEAGKVLKQIMKTAQQNGMNILYDGTMHSYEKMRDLIRLHRKAGYGLEMAFADLPLEKSMERALARFMGDTGRFVDPLYIATHQKKNINTFKKLRQYYGKSFDNWHHYSTDVPFKQPAILLDSKVKKPAITTPKAVKLDYSDYDDILKKAEADIRFNDFETAIGWDEFGQESFRIGGARFSVNFTGYEHKVKNAIVTHNHPRGLQYAADSFGYVGNSFSAADIFTSMRLNAKEMRAVTPSYTFVMKRPKGGWPSESVMKRAFLKYDKKVQEELIGPLFNKEGSWFYNSQERAGTFHYHMVWKLVAKELGLPYSKARL